MQHRYPHLLTTVCFFGHLLSFCKLNGDNLDYSTAVERFSHHSPALKVSEMEIGVKESELYQASLCHNPEFSVEYENGEAEGDAEMTYVISQHIELGGKHSIERRIAAIEACAALWEHEIIKQDLTLELTHAFIDAAVAQEKLNLAEEQSKLAEESLKCLQERVRHGKASSLTHKKASMQCCCLSIAATKAKQTYAIAKQKIAVMCGMAEQEIATLSFPFYTLTPPPPFDELVEKLEFAPEISKGVLGRLAAEAATDFERANRYPDVEVSAGIATEKVFQSPSVLFEVSFPLPIFDRNQGNISRAIFQEWQALYLQESQLTIIKSKLESTYAGWRACFEASQALANIVNTSAEEQVKDTEEGYDKGKFEKCDVLEAQKASLEVKDQYIDAIAEYHHQKADTLRLIGDLSGITR